MSIRLLELNWTIILNIHVTMNTLILQSYWLHYWSLSFYDYIVYPCYNEHSHVILCDTLITFMTLQLVPWDVGGSICLMIFMFFDYTIFGFLFEEKNNQVVIDIHDNSIHVWIKRDSVKDTWNGECEGEIKGDIKSSIRRVMGGCQLAIVRITKLSLFFEFSLLPSIS